MGVPALLHTTEHLTLLIIGIFLMWNVIPIIFLVKVEQTALFMILEVQCFKTKMEQYQRSGSRYVICL